MARSYIPVGMQEGLIKEHHQGYAGGHLGQKKMYQRLQQKFYWPKMAEDVKVYIAGCESCITHKFTPEIKMPLQYTCI